MSRGIRSWIRVCERRRGKLRTGQCPKQSPKPRIVFSGVEEKRPVLKELRETARRSQCANLGLCVRWEGLRDLATEIASQLLYTRCEDQHVDLGIFFMSTPMKSVQYQENLVAFKKYQLRGAQDVVRHNVETDRGTLEILNVSTMIYTVSSWMSSSIQTMASLFKHIVVGQV